jgi:hypothetical protein
MSLSSDDLHQELSFLRDNLITAIREHRPGSVEDGLEIYEQLITEFVNLLSDVGVSYDRESARREQSSIEGGWAEIEWMRRDLRDITDAAFDSGDLRIIQEVLSFVYSIVRLGIQKNDYYVFSHFLGWMPYFYERTARKVGDPDDRSGLVHHIVLILSEIGNLMILPRVEDAESEDEARRMRDFGLGLEDVYNRLLKVAYDIGAQPDFSTFARGLSECLVSHSLGDTPYAAEQLEQLLAQDHLDDETRARYESRLGLIRGRLESDNLWESRRRIIFFGLDAWLLRDYRAGNLSVDDFRSWDSATPPPAGLNELWETYLEATAFETERELGWLWWDLPERPAGRATFSGGYEQFLHPLMTIRLIELASRADPESLSQVTLRPDRQVEYLASAHSPLLRILDSMPEDDALMALVGPEGFQAVPAVRNLLTRTLSDYELVREQRLVNAPLSQGKVLAFQDELLTGWREASMMRAAIASEDRVVLVGERPPTVPFRGFNSLERKDAFVEEETLSAEGLAREYGRALSRMEDGVVVEKLSEALSLFAPDTLVDDGLLEACDRAVHDLVSRGLSPTILTVDAWAAVRTLSTSTEFRYLSATESRASAEYRGAPVFQLYEGPEPAVYVIALGAVGELRTYSPGSDDATGDFVADAILFSITDISEARAHELLEQQPALVRADSDEPLTVEEGVRRLQQRVHLRALEAVEYVLVDPRSGWKLLAERD